MSDLPSFSRDDIRYAAEMTRVVYEPDRRIDTFGDTRFNFLLLSELMDEAGVVRVRSGWVEAEKPKIIRPSVYNEVSTEGFSGEAKRFFEGVDDAWEVSLLKFTVEMIQKSHEINIFDFKRKGLL